MKYNGMKLEKGADRLKRKQLDLPELLALLRHWFPDLQESDFSKINMDLSSLCNVDDAIRPILEIINEFDFASRPKYAFGKPELYIYILEVSLRDIQASIHIIINGHSKNLIGQMRIGVHNLKNVFMNIGATRLSEKAEAYEKIIIQGDELEINMKYNSFMRHVIGFKDKLYIAISKFKNVSLNNREEPTQSSNLMGYAEYEQCLINTIYYIKRYEYDAIIKGLKLLIAEGPPEYRSEFKMILQDIMGFNYDKALLQIEKIKNKTGKNPSHKNQNIH